MRRDAQQVATQGLLTHLELKTHHRTTFHQSVNLLLITSQLQTRAEGVPDLVAALGWCSVVRDLSEDLGKGLVNVPAEVVRRVEAAGGKLTAQHPEIRRWLEEEKLTALNHLRTSAVTLQTLAAHDPRAARLLGVFHRSIARYANSERIGFWRRAFRRPARNGNLKAHPRQTTESEPPSPISAR